MVQSRGRWYCTSWHHRSSTHSGSETRPSGQLAKSATREPLQSSCVCCAKRHLAAVRVTPQSACASTVFRRRSASARGPTSPGICGDGYEPGILCEVQLSDRCGAASECASARPAGDLSVAGLNSGPTLNADTVNAVSESLSANAQEAHGCCAGLGGRHWTAAPDHCTHIACRESDHAR